MTPEEFDSHIKRLKDYPDDEPISVDTENNGTIRAAELWSGQYYCTGISLAYPDEAEGYFSGYFPFRHSEGNLGKECIDILKPILLAHPLIFCNETIDMAALTTLGIEITIPPYDITWLAHMANEEFPAKSLEWLSRFILKEGKDKSKLKRWTDVQGWDDVPVVLMDEYAQQDAVLPFKLFKILKENLS